MTIKTNGGVFGRNPTFYNVNVDGKLTGGALRGSSLGIGVDSLSYLAEFAKASGNTYVMVNQTGASPSAILLGAEGTKNSVYSMTAPGNFTGKDLYLYRGSSLVFNTTSANNIAFPSGQGIDFSATAGTGTSELFDDYEEGVWTPVVRGLTTAGTYELASAVGKYTLVGDIVTIQAFIQLAAAVTGGGAGPLAITGVPFSKPNLDYPTAAAYVAGVVITTSPIVVFSSFSASSTLNLQQNASGGFGTPVGIADIGVNDYVSFSLTYKVV